MRLHDLKPPKGALKRPRRVGRGPGSGRGKTSGRGHKGQLSRSGGGKGPGFEGGQMPLYRRLPKRGFRSRNKERWATLNLRDLAKMDAELIDPDVLAACRKIKGRIDGIKVLGDGTLDRPVRVRAHAFSATAREKIEAAGGTAEVIER